jgi:hypothetical protein
METLKTIRFWVLITIQSCGYGGFTILTNLMVDVADAYGINGSGVFVALLALSSAITRAMFGSVSALFDKHFTLAGQMGLVNLLLALVNILLAFTTNNTGLFAILTIATGFCNGPLLFCTQPPL